MTRKRKNQSALPPLPSVRAKSAASRQNKTLLHTPLVRGYEASDINHNSPRISAGLKRKAETLGKALDTLANALKGVGEDAATVEQFLTENCLQSKDSVQIITELLKRTKSPKKVEQAPGDLKLFDQMFVYRAETKLVLLLAPLEIFDADRDLQSKTFGFIKDDTSEFPLMTAFSGHTEIMKGHPRLLDNKQWANEVLKFARTQGFKLSGFAFEECRGYARGLTSASHVECKLALWYACKKLQIIIGKEEVSTSQFWKLRQVRELQNLEADLYLTDRPCRGCEGFVQMVTILTGIKFHYKIVPNLAVLPVEMDGQGLRKYRPRGLKCRPAPEKSDSEEELEDYSSTEESEEEALRAMLRRSRRTDKPDSTSVSRILSFKASTKTSQPSKEIPLNQYGQQATVVLPSRREATLPPRHDKKPTSSKEASTTRPRSKIFKQVIETVYVRSEETREREVDSERKSKRKRGYEDDEDEEEFRPRRFSRY